MTHIAVPRDCIDLLLSFVVTQRLDRWKEDPQRTLQGIVAEADILGRELWASNYRAVSAATGTALEPPAYEWTPVAELVVDHPSPEQLIQIERTRRTLLEQCGGDSDVGEALHSVGAEIDKLLSAAAWAVVPSHLEAGGVDYAGIRAAEPIWRRELGLPRGRWAGNRNGRS